MELLNFLAMVIGLIVLAAGLNNRVAFSVGISMYIASIAYLVNDPAMQDQRFWRWVLVFIATILPFVLEDIYRKVNARKTSQD